MKFTLRALIERQQTSGLCFLLEIDLNTIANALRSFLGSDDAATGAKFARNQRQKS
jgi:hypothetical protein